MPLTQSPTLLLTNSHIYVFQERCLPYARFDMLITGDEIPSWFVLQRTVSWAKIQVPNNCFLDDWVGFSLCFLLISHADPPELCKHEIEIYLFARNGKQLIASRTLPPMNPYYPHLYILYLSIDQFHNVIIPSIFI